MSWLAALRHYLVFLGLANFAWEVAQLPLYTIWIEKGWTENAFAVFHCTLGDLAIATIALAGSLFVVGHQNWPKQRFSAVAASAIALGVAYTVFSEWINTEVRGAWTYRDIMPTLPVLGTGLSPLGQWIVIPSAAFLMLRRKLLRNDIE